MPNYPGKRKGTRRIVIWTRLEGEAKSKPREWIVRGSKKDGDAFEAVKRLELNTYRRTALRTAPSFEVFCVEHYAPHAKAHLKETTWRKVRRYQVETLCKFFGPIKLSELTIADVEKYKAARISAAPIAVNSDLRVFRTILNYARSLGVVVPELRWKRIPVRGKGRVRVWTEEQVQALYAAARSEAPEILPILIFMLNTGVRKGEAIACEWSWIDFEADLIRMPTNEFWQPKSDKPREIPIGDAVRAVLTSLPREGRWVFPSNRGRRYVDFPKERFWAARDAAGLTGGAHTTRHTFASHFLARTKDLKMLSEIMGHSLGKVTEIYTHLLPGRLDEARNAVNLSPVISGVSKKSSA